MSASVLMNLLNRFGKSDIKRVFSSNLFLFRNEFNRYNNSQARMLESVYHTYDV